MSASLDSRKPSRAPIIALTGFMAAGKSTLGRALAWLLRWRFVDLDYEVECLSQLSVREIFAQQGEVRFREIEAEALRSVMAQATTPTVIALGGGTFVQPQNAELLRQSGAQVVFLELAVEQLLVRCRAARERSAQNPRPLAEEEEAFCALYAQRLPFYRQADMIVDTENKSPEEIAREIAERLRLTGSSS